MEHDTFPASTAALHAAAATSRARCEYPEDVSNKVGDHQKPECRTHSSIKIPRQLSHAASIDPGNDQAPHCEINKPHGTAEQCLCEQCRAAFCRELAADSCTESQEVGFAHAASESLTARVSSN